MQTSEVMKVKGIHTTVWCHIIPGTITSTRYIAYTLQCVACLATKPCKSCWTICGQLNITSCWYLLRLAWSWNQYYQIYKIYITSWSMIWQFISFTTPFQSYQDTERVNMKGISAIKCHLCLLSILPQVGFESLTRLLSLEHWLLHWLLSHLDSSLNIYEPLHEKTCLQGFRPGKIQTGLCSYRS